MRCSSHDTAKLTTAPMAASSAVRNISCTPSWPTMLSKVPPVVPIPSCWLVFIAFPPFLGGAFHRFQNTQCQGEVSGYDHHLGRQLQRRRNDQLTGYCESFFDAFVNCRLSRFG